MVIVSSQVLGLWDPFQMAIHGLHINGGDPNCLLSGMILQLTPETCMVYDSIMEFGCWFQYKSEQVAPLSHYFGILWQLLELVKKNIPLMYTRCSWLHTIVGFILLPVVTSTRDLSWFPQIYKTPFLQPSFSQENPLKWPFFAMFHFLQSPKDSQNKLSFFQTQIFTYPDLVGFPICLPSPFGRIC